MESPDLTHTQTDASATSKCRNDKENNDALPSVRNGQHKRPLAALDARGAALDAPERLPEREFIPLRLVCISPHDSAQFRPARRDFEDE